MNLTSAGKRRYMLGFLSAVSVSGPIGRGNLCGLQSGYSAVGLTPNKK